jgi:hypothetical protein
MKRARREMEHERCAPAAFQLLSSLCTAFSGDASIGAAIRRLNALPGSAVCRRRVAEHSSDDDEHFQKNEAARLARDTGWLASWSAGSFGLALDGVCDSQPACCLAACSASDPGLAPVRQSDMLQG